MNENPRCSAAEVMAILRNHLERAGLGDVARDDLSFTGVGGDSLAAAEVIHALKHRHRCDVPISWFFDGRSLRELSDAIARAAQ
jgi:acyl carrier protein